MATDTVVNLIPDTKALLTVETVEGGRPVGVPCNKDGKALTRDEMQHSTREVYMNAMDHEHYMRISHEEKEAIQQAGGEFYQGIGTVHGWFVPAPDYTLVGRFGERTPKKEPPAKPKAN